MARDEEKKEAPKAAREAVNETESSADEETYSIEWLVGASGALGYKPSEIAGALSVAPKKNLTIEEAKAAVKAWLGSPVKEA